MKLIDDYFDEESIEMANVTYFKREGHFMQPSGGMELKQALEHFINYVQSKSPSDREITIESEFQAEMNYIREKEDFKAGAKWIKEQLNLLK